LISAIWGTKISTSAADRAIGGNGKGWNDFLNKGKDQ
jgi:hypothetical protein